MTRTSTAAPPPLEAEPRALDYALGEGIAELAPGALDRLGAHVRAAAPAYRYVLITDDHVGPLYAARGVASFGADRVDVLVVPAGEHSKTRASWAALTDEMLTLGCGRDTTVIALGGGVIGDLAGFVAATFMRGVSVVQVPTTLVAMIDAAIGGKTGVDTPAGKNLVGAFHAPATVLVDPALLGTLPPAQLRAGMAEALKHGIVGDAAYFDRIVATLPICLAPRGAESAEMTALIDGSIRIKAAIVASDAHEHGRRKILNFGHTIGHAVEAASDYALLHGEAVAIGMAVESRLAELAGVASPELVRAVRAALDQAGLPSRMPASTTAAEIVARTHADKKVREGRVEYALPRSLGQMAGADTGWAVPLSDAFVTAALA